MVEHLVGSYRVSERHACRTLCVPRATYRYRSCIDPRTELRMRIREIAQARVRYGYRKIRVLLNREGWEVGKYLAYRLYTEEGLTLKRMKPAGKRKLKLPDAHADKGGDAFLQKDYLTFACSRRLCAQRNHFRLR